MNWPANINIRLLQAERDLTRAERRAELAQGVGANLKKELEHALALLKRERARTATLQRALDEVYASTSWRVSGPVRVLSRLVTKVTGGSQPGPASTPPDDEPARTNAPALPHREAAILQRLQRETD